MLAGIIIVVEPMSNTNACSHRHKMLEAFPPKMLHVRPCAVLCRFPITYPTAISMAQIAYSVGRVNRNITLSFSLVGKAVFTLFRRFSQGQQQKEKTHRFCRHCRHDRHQSTAPVSFGYHCSASCKVKTMCTCTPLIWVGKVPLIYYR